jgi:hypothetical protein
VLDEIGKWRKASVAVATMVPSPVGQKGTHACPGVPTVLGGRERFLDKDRVAWVAEGIVRHNGRLS